jgi:hypothetical protein
LGAWNQGSGFDLVDIAWLCCPELISSCILSFVQVLGIPNWFHHVYGETDFRISPFLFEILRADSFCFHPWPATAKCISYISFSSKSTWKSYKCMALVWSHKVLCYAYLFSHVFCERWNHHHNFSLLV